MTKYKGKGGGFSGFGLAFIIFLVAVGLIALTVWLVLKNTPPATCDVSVSGVNSATTSTNGFYPVTISYSGNGSNACNSSVKVKFDVTLTPPSGSSGSVTNVTTTEVITKNMATVDSPFENPTVSISYYIINADGSEGPHHTY